MKNSGTWIGQTRAELLLEIMGHQGLGWEGEAFERTSWRRCGWLSGKASTIFGGTQEVQSQHRLQAHPGPAGYDAESNEHTLDRHGRACPGHP